MSRKVSLPGVRKVYRFSGLRVIHFQQSFSGIDFHEFFSITRSPTRHLLKGVNPSARGMTKKIILSPLLK